MFETKVDTTLANDYRAMTHTSTAASLSAPTWNKAGDETNPTGSLSSHEAGERRSANHSSEVLEQFSYDDDIVRWFVAATILWGIVGTSVGVLVAFLLVAPSITDGLRSDVSSVLSFARLRPLHTNAAIFAFAGNAIFAAIYYSTQRLCKARMWSDVLSRLHFWGWQAIIVAAALTLPFGITQSKEYAELEWPIDIAIAVVWLLFFGVNFMMTLINRRERHMYVALWFYIATIVTVTVLHVFNNLVVPIGLGKSYSIYAGVQDALMQWWYGHNAVAFFLTTPFLGLMYYFMPKAAERPVFSYKLSIIHFWSLVFIYIWAGPHSFHGVIGDPIVSEFPFYISHKSTVRFGRDRLEIAPSCVMASCIFWRKPTQFVFSNTRR
jgi:cytochrome c oxidase cbb3-type subunit I/II